MIHKFHLLKGGIAVLAFAAATITAAAASAGTVVYVADVEQLYAAENDPTNEGAAIISAAGTYVLTANNPAGVARPNDGRLELRQDMSLYGVAGDRAAVVLNAGGLPSSFLHVRLAGRAAHRRDPHRARQQHDRMVDRVGKSGGGRRDRDGAPGRIEHADQSRHVVSDGTSRGVDVRNAGWANNAGRLIDAEIVDNEFIGPTVVQGMSEGIRLANFVGADRGVIVATLRGNSAHGFQLGCIVANNRSSNVTVYVRSSGDRFFANARGCLIAGGLNQSPTDVANSNSTVFEAFGSKVFDNTATIAYDAPGGIRVGGGLSTMRTYGTSYNTVSVSLTGSRSRVTRSSTSTRSARSRPRCRDSRE